MSSAWDVIISTANETQLARDGQRSAADQALWEFLRLAQGRLGIPLEEVTLGTNGLPLSRENVSKAAEDDEQDEKVRTLNLFFNLGRMEVSVVLQAWWSGNSGMKMRVGLGEETEYLKSQELEAVEALQGILMNYALEAV